MVMTPDTQLGGVRFPASGHIWIPNRGRRAAAAGLSMHSPCNPIKVFGQRALYLAVRLFGAKVIAGEPTAWSPPIAVHEWTALTAAWREAAGDFDSVAIYSRPQAGRAGFAALLLDRGRGVAFARVHPDRDRINNEYSVMGHVFDARPEMFNVARPIAKGHVQTAAWMLTESLPNYPLGALRNSHRRDGIADEISGILVGALRRPSDVPLHWVPAHGDFSPWNLRTGIGGAVHVIDWEDAGFAPPGTDQLYGALSAHTTFGSPVPSVVPPEAAAWMADLLSARITAEGVSSGVNHRMRGALRAIPATS